MIARLFRALDVDYHQWRALTKAALVIDFRSAVARGQHGSDARATGAIVAQVLFYTVMGFFISLFVMFGGDLFLSANVVLAYVMFMVGMAALLDHNAAITSPDDFHVLGFRPVTSRTYFAARITNVLVYVAVMTTLFGYLPVGAFFLRWGAGVGLASIGAVYGSAIFTAFAMVAVYSWLIRITGPRRIRRALSYVQFAFSFVVYGGYFIGSRMLSEQMLAQLTIPKTIWVLAIPVTWFASYMELAAGRWSQAELAPAAVSIVALIGFATLISGRMSLDYSDRLGAIASATAERQAQAPAKERKSWWFTSGEARAIALLIRRQFANDLKFRMSVLAVLPLTIIYLMMSVSRTGTIQDPFQEADRGRGLGMVTIAMMMFPAMLKASLGRSDAFRASWIFFASPSDRTRLVRAAKDVLVVTFLLPYVVCVAIVVSFFTENIPHLLVHLLVIGLISHLVLQTITLIDPELPFSKPIAKNRTSFRVFVLVSCVSVGGIFIPLLAPVLYRSATSIAMTIGVIVVASLVIDRLTRVRIERQMAALEFEG